MRIRGWVIRSDGSHKLTDWLLSSTGNWSKAPVVVAEKTTNSYHQSIQLHMNYRQLCTVGYVANWKLLSLIPSPPHYSFQVVFFSIFSILFMWCRVHCQINGAISLFTLQQKKSLLRLVSLRSSGTAAAASSDFQKSKESSPAWKLFFPNSATLSWSGESAISYFQVLFLTIWHRKTVPLLCELVKQQQQS